MKLNFGIVIFPGTSGAEDVQYVLEEIFEQYTVKIWFNQYSLPKIDALILPSGSTYGDYMGPGKFAANTPIMDAINQFARQRGLVIGFGNGFQILTQAGLLPGRLLINQNKRFIAKNIYLKVDNRYTALTNAIDSEYVLKLPIAHKFGRFQAPDQTITQMRRNGQILFRYADSLGRLTQEANPDGSQENIAGICNEYKNVFGMMPMPERSADDELGNTDGMLIFHSLIKHIQQKLRAR